MRRPSTILLLALLASACTAPAPTLAQPAAPEAPVARSASGAAATGTRRALLIGVDEYAPVLDGSRRIPSLVGPANDVPLMRDVLAERGFTEIATLLGEAATRQGILDAIDALVASAAPGDHLAVYYSGHGAQVDVEAGDERDGKYETIVPYDAGLGASDIVDKTLRQRFNRALDAVGPSGSLTVIQDNCHSGSGSRDPLAWTPRQAEPATEAEIPGGEWGPPPNERGALLLSASQDLEVAIERSIDGTVYGGFTWSLANALRATPPGAPANLVFERTLAQVRALGLKQEGVIEGPADRPLFGEAPAPGGGFGVGVVAVEGGLVTLRGGPFMGLDAGATLRRILTATEAGAPQPDETVALRVVETEDAVRSVAEVTEGDAASVRVGDLFRITRPVPMRTAHPLRLWLPPAVADEAAAIAVPEADCPAPTCSTAPVARPAAVVLPASGGTRSVEAADAGSGVAYRPLPPTAALRSALVAGLEDAAGVELTDDPAGADYWLAGELSDGALRYRWVRRATATSGDTLVALPAHRDAASGGEAQSLVGAARRIARVQSWLTVPSPETASFPVQALGLRRRADGLVLRPDAAGVLTIPPSRDTCTPAPEGCYTLALGVTEADLARYREAAIWDRWDTRFAYAFLIDPDGESCLYFPYNRCSEGGGGVENTLGLAEADGLARMPTTAGDSVHVFDLGRLSPPFAFKSGPFGRHTLVLLTMNERMPNPGAAFNWPAVSVGTRGDVEGPGSWSVHRLTIDVVPGAPAPSAPPD